MLTYNTKAKINTLDFNIEKCRVKVDMQILKTNDDIIAKYLYIVSSSLLNNLKSRSLIKGHSRLINKHVLKSYLRTVFYSNSSLSNAMFDKMWGIMISSQFVEFHKKHYCQLVTKLDAVFKLTNVVYSNSVMLSGVNELQKFTLLKFKSLAISLLYSEPQIIQKGSHESTFISQDKIAKYLNITQGAVSASVKHDKKIFVYEEISEKLYKTIKSASKYTDTNKFVTKIKDLSKIRYLVTNPIDNSTIKNPLSYNSYKIYDNIKSIQGVRGTNTLNKTKYATPMNNVHELYIRPDNIINYINDRFEYPSKLEFKNSSSDLLIGYVGHFRRNRNTNKIIDKNPYKYYVLRGTKLMTKYTFTSTVLYTKKNKTKHKSFAKLVNDKKHHYKFKTTSKKAKIKLFANSYNAIKLDPEVRNYINEDNMNSQVLNIQIVSKNLKDSLDKLKIMSVTNGKVNLPTDSEILWKVKQHLNEIRSLHNVCFPSNSGILLSKEISNMITLVKMSTLSDLLKILLINRLCLFSERNDIHTAMI